MTHDLLGQPEWKGSLKWARFALGSSFPDEKVYSISIWEDWQTRIDQGHEAEEALIAQQYAEWESQMSDSDGSIDPGFDSADWLSDYQYQTCRLTSSMYAVLVVAIWAEMETILKRFAHLCGRYAALQPKLSFFKRLLHCLPFLKPKDTHISGSLHKFQNIKKYFNRFFKQNNTGNGVFVFSAISKYHIVNAVRILNNTFKHNDGLYRPTRGNHVDQALLTDWNILDDNGRIDYSKLPIRDLVLACNTFCLELLDRIESELDAGQHDT